MRDIPHSWNLSIASAVSNGVADGVTFVRRPSPTEYRISS